MLVFLGDSMSQKLSRYLERITGQNGEVATAAVRVERPSSARANKRRSITQTIESSGADPRAGRCGGGAGARPPRPYADF